MHSSRLENRCWAVVLNFNNGLARYSFVCETLFSQKCRSCANAKRKAGPVHVFPRCVLRIWSRTIRFRFPRLKKRTRANILCSNRERKSILPTAFIDMDDTTWPQVNAFCFHVRLTEAKLGNFRCWLYSLFIFRIKNPRDKYGCSESSFYVFLLTFVWASILIRYVFILPLFDIFGIYFTFISPFEPKYYRILHYFILLTFSGETKTAVLNY